MHDIAGWNSILFRNARKKEFIRKNKKSIVFQYWLCYFSSSVKAFTEERG